MYRFTKNISVAPDKMEQRGGTKSKTSHSRDKHSSPLFSMPCYAEKNCAMPRIVSSLVDMLTQWFEFPSDMVSSADV